MKTDVKKTVTAADPQMSHSSKLAQIQSGAKNKRTTGGEKKNIVITGKDGSKIIQSQKEEKYEETSVLRKKKNYVMYEAKLGTETTTDYTQIDAPRPKLKPKTPRPPEPRMEERIVIKKKRKEYLDNYQYHETKNIKNPNPRFQVTVEHKRLGDIIGGTFEQTSYEKQVFAQGSSRPQITEKKTTVKTTGTANQPKLRGNKSEVTGVKKTTVTTTRGGAAPTGPSTVSKRTTTTTTTKTVQKATPTTTTAKNEKVVETTMKRRNDGTGSKTETKTETKTTTSGRGGQNESSTTTKTTTKTLGEKPTGESATEAQTTQKTSTTTKTTTTTTKTTGGDGAGETTTTTTTTKATGGESGANTETKTETKTETMTETKTETKTEAKTETKTEPEIQTEAKTETKVEQSGSTEVKEEKAAGGEASSIRKKYAKNKFEVSKQD